MVEKKSARGGARPGAGRPRKGSPPRRPVLNDVVIADALAAPPPDEIDVEVARFALDAIEALVRILKFGTSEPALIVAAKEILDRGYGKPTVEIGGDALPFLTAPSIAAAPSIASDVRTEARRHARLAVATLRHIAANGTTLSACVAASRALLDRGLGTVAAASVPDLGRERPLGKKEEAARAAAAAASGLYAPREPPRPPGGDSEPDETLH